MTTDDHRASLPPVTPRDLFVFVGAGLSMSSPAHLPNFNSLRDTLLESLGLEEYVPPRSATTETLTGPQRRVRDIQPEPFFYALEDAGIDVQRWLNSVLEPETARPNVAHEAVAELCLAGARVWTVNFDRFIEKVPGRGPQITPVCAPDQTPTTPGGDGELLKPHGSIGGRLIVTPAETLAPPGADWQNRLRSDLHSCTHAVFVGYSGRDFDFRYLWDAVLTHQTVWWFARSGDRTYERKLLRNADSEGRLIFPTPHIHSSPDRDRSENPSWDFVRWCENHGLIEARSDEERDTLLADSRVSAHGIARPPEGTLIARAAIAELLGDLPAARRLLRHALCHPDSRREARSKLGKLFLAIPSRQARWVTSLWRVVPPITLCGRHWRQRLRYARLSQLSNHGEHSSVLSVIGARGALPETAQIFRLTALKMLGDLHTVRDEARDAVVNPPPSSDPAVRCSAAMQWCQALLWAGDYAALRTVLDERFRPLARITNTRWMAWADFIEACLGIADGPADPRIISDLLDSAAARFASEANHTGMVDVATVRLTFLRQQGSVADYVAATCELHQLCLDKPLRPFTAQASLLELSQMYGYHLADLDTARRILHGLRASPYPVHAIAAQVLLGQWNDDEIGSNEDLDAAARGATHAGLDRLALFAQAVRERPLQHRRDVELFFP